VSTKIARRGLKPITVLLRQLQGAMRQTMEEVLEETGLTMAQANVLTELAYGPARSNAELARIHFVTPQTMVEILASVERQGLVNRRPQPEGGRAMLAELTGEGRSKVFAVHLAMRQVEERFLGVLSKEDAARLRRLLEECLAAVEKGKAKS
jgi:DNA-binding MarR family transcriptional regulator